QANAGRGIWHQTDDRRRYDGGCTRMSDAGSPTVPSSAAARAAVPNAGDCASDRPLAEVKGLVKEFPGIRALDDIALAIRRAEVHGIVGENGAGKSTLMKILSGIEQPAAGS